MGIRRTYGKNKKMGRHELMAKTQHAERVRRPAKVRPRRTGLGR